MAPWPAGYVAGRDRRYGETALSSATWSGAGLWYGHDDPAPTAADAADQPAEPRVEES